MSLPTCALTTSANLTIAAATAKTILALVADANAALIVPELSFSFGGTAVDGDQVTCTVLRSGSGGTGTPRSPVRMSAIHSGSVQASGLENYSTNPSGGVEIFREIVHPQVGYTWKPPGGIELKEGEMLEMRCLCATLMTNLVAGRMVFRE